MELVFPVVAFKEIDLLISSNDKLKINLDWFGKVWSIS